MQGKILKKSRRTKAAIIIGIFLLLLLIAATGAYHWWKGTPEYSMRQLSHAVQQKDVTAADAYIDYDSIFDSLWSQVTAEATSQLGENQNDPFSSFGTIIGLGLLENMKPTLKQQMRTSIEKSIEGTEDATSTDATTTEQTFVSLAKRNYSIVKGDKIYISLDNGIKLILKQQPDRHWMISEIEGLDLTDDDASTTSK